MQKDEKNGLLAIQISGNIFHFVGLVSLIHVLLNMNKEWCFSLNLQPEFCILL